LGAEDWSAEARRLRKELRNALLAAADAGILADAPAHVYRLVNLARQGIDEVIAVPHPRNFNRDRSLPHFTRSDGAWFDFAVTLRAGSVVSYSFELRFDGGAPGWVRFDLNPPGHDNDEQGLRSHVHLGSDDDGMSIPYPQQDPVTVLELLLYRVRRTGRERAG
jgi:hypothetical protein